MNFNSIQFLLFYPLVAVLNFVVPRKYRVIPLLIASYYFYMTWSAKLFFLILFTTAVSYASGLLIEKKPKYKTWWMVISVVASLSVLFFFKYYNFFVGTIGSFIGADLTLRLILPVGISFYTFQTLSYSIDVYRGTMKAEHNFLYYALFVSFFPQLVAGPIERPENLLPQLHAEHRFDRENLYLGAKRMMAGFFKKIVVADTVAVYVDAVYNRAGETGGLAIIVATVLFAVQIYCDFSGYTDIAIGCARVMGYRLMQNFNRPYSAENIRDFWARWHISLSSWFKDYLYIPLGGNRKGYARGLVNLLIVFVVSGLWHGAEWTFLLWGLIHGIYRVVGALTHNIRERAYASLGIDTKARPVRMWRTAITFLLVCFAWIFFRANNTAELLLILRQLFTTFGAATVVSELGMTASGAITVVLAIVMMVLIDRKLTLEHYEIKSGAILVGGTSLYLVWAILLAWMILLAGNGSSAFIYFQF